MGTRIMVAERMKTATGASTTCNRTPPSCARCRNHNEIVPLKGHKRYCQYKDCACKPCKTTVQRQKLMAKQTALRRAGEQDRLRQEKGLPIPSNHLNPPTPSSQPPSVESVNPERVEELSRASSPDEASTVEPQKLGPPSTISSDDHIRPVDGSCAVLHPYACHSSNEIWDSILLLINKYGFAVNTSPLLHIILKNVTNDPETVSKLFKEAEEDLRKTNPINEDAWKRTPMETQVFPWPVCYPPTTIMPSAHAIATPTAIYSPFASVRYQPYSTYQTSLVRRLDTFGYTLGAGLQPSRPTVMVPDYLLKAEERLGMKPNSPSSIHSDKSSYSGSVDI